MPMYQALAAFIAALLLACAAGAFVERLRADLLRPVFWLCLSAIAAAISAASSLVSRTRHAGTGMTTGHGWPKPFYFSHVDETGAASHGLDVLYFCGNTAAIAGVLLSLWTIWRSFRR